MMSKSSLIEPHNHTRLVLKYAISSRFLLITLSFLWRYLLSPYDTSASINPTCLSFAASSNSSDFQVLFPRVASALEDSIVWDGVYFVRIAQCGYEYEQSYAFFPLLPICISLLSRTGQFLITLIVFKFLLLQIGRKFRHWNKEILINDINLWPGEELILGI